MPIFPRRIIQRLVCENANFLGRKNTKKIVADLNRMHKDMTLAPEWEVVLMNAFSKLGKVDYEHNFGGHRVPDLWFTPFTNPNQSLAADITAISDKGFDAKNPLTAFRRELMQRVQKRGLRLNSFNTNVNGRQGKKLGRYHKIDWRSGQLHGPFYKGGTKTELMLPGISQFERKIFNVDFDKFLQTIARFPNQNHDYAVFKPEENINVTISYRPRQQFSTGLHANYQEIVHISENRVYEALKDKADQLIESNFDDRLGIILCDGDYTPFHNDWKTVKEVIQFFFDNNPEINFVLTLKVKRDWRNESISVTLHKGQYFDLVGEELRDSIERMVEFLPIPERDTCNAFHLLKSRYPQEGERRGLVARYNDFIEIKISTRLLVELLSGRLSHADFSELQGYVASDRVPHPIPNPFAQCLKKGLMIREVRFESHAPEEDDDAVIIKFSAEPDAAIHQFITPRESPN